MTLLIACIVFIFILLGVSAVQHFHENEMDDFGIALTVEAATITPMVMEEVGEAANRAAPQIQTIVAQTFSENEERYVEVLSDNYIALQSYAQARWPNIEEAIAVLVVEQEDTARTTLTKYVPEDKLSELSMAYDQALRAYIEGFFSEHFAGDMVNAQDMVDKLHKLSETETDMPPADSHYIIGMFLELLGLEMQNNVTE